MKTNWYLESKLSGLTGASRQDIEKFRSANLEKKAGDWKKDGRDVVWSGPALNLLLEKMGCAELDASSCLQTNGADEPEGALELIVSHIFPNPKLLLAVVKADPLRSVRVRVPSNDNFRPKMLIMGRPDPRNPGLYQLEGRCPRYPGRW